jgi:DNA-binding NarL/FixJ family response regulator
VYQRQHAAGPVPRGGDGGRPWRRAATPRRPPPTEQAHQDQLSDREREVLILVADGLANKQIARQLGITERTQAALWAERNGLRRGP